MKAVKKPAVLQTGFLISGNSNFFMAFLCFRQRCDFNLSEYNRASFTLQDNSGATTK